jgi:hypothetical protein
MSINQKYNVKFSLCGENDLRRISIPASLVDSGSALAFLSSHVRGLGVEIVKMRYRDEEGDMCVIANEYEFVEALKSADKGV